MTGQTQCALCSAGYYTPDRSLNNVNNITRFHIYIDMTYCIACEDENMENTSQIHNIHLLVLTILQSAVLHQLWSWL